MAEVMEMLALSPTMSEGTLGEWRKREGDLVAEGEVIAEVETDKATMEMESFYGGTILKLLAAPGQTVTVGEPLAIIGKPGEDIAQLLAGMGKGGGAAAAPSAPSAPSAPAVQPAAPEAVVVAAAPAPVATPEGGRLKASPLARRIAKEQGLELAVLNGSGPGGRIVRRDVEEAMARPKAAASAPVPAPAPPASAALPVAGIVPTEVPGTQQPLSQMRKTIARRLAQSWQSVPHFYLTMDVDMAPAMAQREQINQQLKSAGLDVKVSVNDLIIKACAVALERYPKVNVAFQGDYVVQYDEVNIGVAVAVDDGLVTPSVTKANTKGLATIAREARDLALRARERKLRPEEFTSHTFSISNLGMYGIENFQAVINPPDAAILACGAVQQVPVVIDGQLAVGTRMKMTLSCDHRAVDGATGSEFLLKVKELLEHPVLLLV